MPYIPKDRREALHSDSVTDFDNTPGSKGELNFLISELLIDFTMENGVSYKVCSDALGAALDAAEEYRRRILNPYEDRMIKKNGDIYKGLIKEMRKKR